MRTPDDGRAPARDRYAMARSTAHADNGLFHVLRATELEAGARLPGRGAIPSLKRTRRRLPGTHRPGATRVRRA
jgi:hypothetical protein